MTISFLEGNEAIGWGAMAAGCRFFCGYPITPAMRHVVVLEMNLGQ